MLTSYVVIAKAPNHIFSSSCKNHSHVDFLPLWYASTLITQVEMGFWVHPNCNIDNMFFVSSVLCNVVMGIVFWFLPLWYASTLVRQVEMGSWVHPNCDIDNMFCVSLASSMGIVVVIFTIFCGWYLLPKSLVGKNKAPLPPGTSGLPFIGESFAFIRACKANKVLEEFLNPRVAKYGQVHAMCPTHPFSSLCFHSHIKQKLRTS